MAHRYPLDSTGRSTTGGVKACMLLVEPDGELADAMQQHFSERLPAVVATQCRTLESARAYLGGNIFDTVLTADELPDGCGLDLLDLQTALGLESYFFVHACRNGQTSEAAMKAGATACFALTPEHENLDAVSSAISQVLGMADNANVDAVDVKASQNPLNHTAVLLEELRAETGAVVHAINNPLTVITGNAQLLLEVAHAEQADSSIVGPIEDINSAAQQLSDALVRLSALRERIADTLGTDDRIDEA